MVAASDARRAGGATSALSERLMHMVMHLQFAWWAGHVSVVVCTLLYYVAFTVNAEYDTRQLLYSLTMLSAMLSYAVAGYKSLGMPRINLAFLQQILGNDSIHYLLLALLWYRETPLIVTLIPFAVFSALHTVTYFHSTVVPILAPSTPEQSPKPLLARLSAQLDSISRRRYTAVMLAVSRWEVMVVPIWLILQFFMFNISLMTLPSYFMFLRLRYMSSQYHQETFRLVRTTLDNHLVNNPSTPPMITNLYTSVRDFVINMSGLNLPRHQSPPTAGYTPQQQQQQQRTQ